MGGAIAKMITPFKLFAGGPIGTVANGLLIYREDLVNLILQALTRPDSEGVQRYRPSCSHGNSARLWEVLNRPSWLPVPGLAFRSSLGDAAMVVLEGQQVLPSAP